MGSNIQKFVEGILASADVTVNGRNSWDIQVHDKVFFVRAITEGELGVGESYMAGWWDAEKVDETIFRILRARLDGKVRKKIGIALKLFALKLFNLQSRRRAFIVGERHYNLGNELFQAMLDPRMNYAVATGKMPIT
ncbi:MAG: class I SAM-dependent methyltransferase [Prolixibacteraceae bacterium]|jgi:cyclopropane-fatty-acyl-phospholipid synthase|nr:class I SAM-dependent methyltransferase [Prolixibacteraceae bacterium]